MHNGEPDKPDFGRRTLITALALVGALQGVSSEAWGAESPPPGAPGDFDFLIGSWRVHHHRLVGRLVGSTKWEDFEGTCDATKFLGGQANIDDNLLHIPSGDYRGASIRIFDSKKSVWAIYWIDSRAATIDVPVFGGFRGAEGLFLGDDQLDGKPIKVRFLWFVDSADVCRWEQAFSANAGQTWETNWKMRFVRA